MTRSTTLHFSGIAVAASLLATVAAAPGFAQGSDPSARAVTSNPVSANRPARKSAKPAPRAPIVSASEKPWTLENALPDHSAAMRQYDYTPPQSKFGRVPLQSGAGTVGFETETKTNAYKTPDGRTIPGLEATESRSNSYMGLSLSVPTSDKAMNFPLPLVPQLNPP
jgi:hypothetical protein